MKFYDIKFLFFFILNSIWNKNSHYIVYYSFMVQWGIGKYRLPHILEAEKQSISIVVQKLGEVNNDAHVSEKRGDG